MKPCPKPEPRLKEPQRAIAKISDRHDATFWPKQRAAIREIQKGVCGWCVKERDLDCAHIKGLGRLATRNDADHPLNQLANLIGLCRQCHREFDRQSVAWRNHNGPLFKDRFDVLPGHGQSRTGGIR